MTEPDAMATIAFLSNELRRAVETVTAQQHVLQQRQAEIERLNSLLPQDPKPAKGKP